jgi:hypothetical protein
MLPMKQKKQKNKKNNKKTSVVAETAHACMLHTIAATHVALRHALAVMHSRVNRVDPRVLHLDENLLRTWRGDGHLLHLQNIRTACMHMEWKCGRSAVVMHGGVSTTQAHSHVQLAHGGRSVVEVDVLLLLLLLFLLL